MPETSLELLLRPATLEDAPVMADLEAVLDPDDPRDPVLLRHWWTSGELTLRAARWVAERDGAAIASVSVGHQKWDRATPRYGWTRPRLHPSVWTDADFDGLIMFGEAWLRSEEVGTAVLYMRDDLPRELEVAERRGYREVRRARRSELALEEHRDAIIANAAESRARMADGGIELLVFDDLDDAAKAEKLYELEVETEKDIPSTVPMLVPSFEHWRVRRFENPGLRNDRLWLAREGAAIVGMSQLGYPPVRGVPFTDYTATSRSVRGRGVARALKYQTLAQALELGVTRVRTNNDASNGPILHINQEMGYREVVAEVEMHRELSS